MDMNNLELVGKPTEKNSYIVKDTLPNRAYDFLSEKITDGYKGLCVTRTNPADIKKKYNIDMPIIWLSNQKNKDFLTSTNIITLKNRIKDFIKKNKKAIILLDRVDYLINMHGFTDILKLIYSINDEILINKSILMLNVNPDTLNPQELSLLEQEFQELPKSKPEFESELPDDLHEILVLVNNNEKISFKKVSKEFSITKTTTRKRINNLAVKGLITIKKNGRNKIVRITELGKTVV